MEREHASAASCVAFIGAMVVERRAAGCSLGGAVRKRAYCRVEIVPVSFLQEIKAAPRSAGDRGRAPAVVSCRSPIVSHREEVARRTNASEGPSGEGGVLAGHGGVSLRTRRRQVVGEPAVARKSGGRGRLALVAVHRQEELRRRARTRSPGRSGRRGGLLAVREPARAAAVRVRGQTPSARTANCDPVGDGGSVPTTAPASRRRSPPTTCNSVGVSAFAALAALRAPALRSELQFGAPCVRMLARTGGTRCAVRRGELGRGFLERRDRADADVLAVEEREPLVERARREHLLELGRRGSKARDSSSGFPTSSHSRRQNCGSSAATVSARPSAVS